LAESTSIVRFDLSFVAGVPARRTLWPDEPDEAFSGFCAEHIAEGHGRLSTGEYRQFLGIARGSNFELQTQIEIARALGFGKPKLLDDAEGLSHEVGKMIYGVLEGIKAKDQV